MLPKTSTFVKYYDGQTKWKYFLIEDDDLLKKYNTIWDKGRLILKENLKASPPTMKNVIIMKLQIFTIKKSQMWTLITAD